jgi:hypothetical protein
MVFDHVRGNDHYLANVRARMSGSAHGTALVEKLIERKHRLFPDDYRLIGEYRVSYKQGTLNLWAEARDPYNAKATTS